MVSCLDGSPMQKTLLFVDRVSTWVGHAFSWLHRRAHAAGHLGGVLALRARRAARLGFRRHDHVLRHALHDGRRLHAGEERPRARRRALRLLRAAHAGGARSHALHRLLHSRRVRADLRRLLLRRRVLAINEHSNVTYEGPPVYPFKTVIPLAGAILLAQGIVEIIRCVICLKQGDGRRARRTSRKWTSTS